MSKTFPPQHVDQRPDGDSSIYRNKHEKTIIYRHQGSHHKAFGERDSNGNYKITSGEHEGKRVHINSVGMANREKEHIDRKQIMKNHIKTRNNKPIHYPVKRNNVDEEAPTNAAGNGGIDGIGIGPNGEPGISRKIQSMIQKHKGQHMMRRRKFAGNDVFVVDNSTFHKATMGKKKWGRWKNYVGESDMHDEIKEFAYKHPYKPIVLQNEMTGAMQYLRYGGKQ